MIEDVKIEYIDFSYCDDAVTKKAHEANKIIIQCLVIRWESFANIMSDKNYTDALLNMSDKHKAMMYDRNKSYGAGVMDWTADLIDYLYDSQCPDFDEDDYFAPWAA